MKRFCIFLAAAVSVFNVSAGVRMPRFFSDNMVLQRDMPVRVWGRASAGDTVEVRLGGTAAAAVADSSGRWLAELPPMQPGGPFEMSVEGPDSTLVFGNVMIGDVWLCSGQSNMEWPLDMTEGSAEEIAASSCPAIRLLTVGRNCTPDEQEDIAAGSWEECSPETSPDFSAVAYYFGRFVYRQTGVPVGLVDSSWGGTDIEPWTSWDTMRTAGRYRVLSDCADTREAMGESLVNWERYEEALRNDPGDTGKWYMESSAEDGWDKMHVPGIWSGPLAETDGNVWFRKLVSIPRSMAGKSAVLSIPAVDDADVTYINGRLAGETYGYSLRRLYHIPEGVLRQGENLIAVKVFDRVSDGGIWGDAENFYIEAGGERICLAGEWEYRPSATTAMYDATLDATHPNNFASLLYNGMIHPLTGYGIKGVIWYQGENNVPRASEYRELFPAMIRDWRKAWGYDFPFLWVQLASYLPVREEPSESRWAELREAQNLALSLPYTGQVVITDIGDASDIHPRDKRNVGLRLARCAMNVAYGMDTPASGPVFRSMETEGSVAILTFDTSCGSLRPADGNRNGYLKGFAVAGADRKFRWAKARILGSRQVAVFSEDVPDPVAVRYGWADNPCDNDLTDGSGLLASPFRTDNWSHP